MEQDALTRFDGPAELAVGFGKTADRISLRDHILTLDIGAFAEERGRRQRVAFTVIVDVRSDPGPVADDVDRILSYDLILSAIETAVTAGRINLLETLAEEIAADLLDLARAARVLVRIEKLDRVSGRLGVEIVRTGVGVDTSTQPIASARPQVYCLAPDAVEQAGLAGWLATLDSGPVVVAIEGGRARPHAGSALAQRRIDLLASEQAGWALAARIPALKVVATRTEFEHAFKSGIATIWAPSKMVFDAAGGVGSVPVDFAAMVAWFAAEIGAKALTYVGRQAPATSGFAGPVTEASLDPAG